jgi:GNAT superfamily N-acetyltransferase
MENLSSTEYVFSMTEADDDADRAFIRQQLRAYNAATMPQFYGVDRAVPALNIYIRDSHNRLVGGVTAEIHWDWLNIEYLWVDEAQRGQGLGARLVRSLEAEAQAHGCCHATLTTFDFQARGFYEKFGLPRHRSTGRLSAGTLLLHDVQGLLNSGLRTEC